VGPIGQDFIGRAVAGPLHWLDDVTFNRDDLVHHVVPLLASLQNDSVGGMRFPGLAN